MFWHIESGKFIIIQNIATQDAHRYVFMVRACVRIYTCGVGYVLLFGLKAIPEPDVRNSKIAVPLFVCLFLWNILDGAAVKEI